jgi:phosphomannomutase
MDRVSNSPPKQVLHAPVTAVTDFRTGGERRPRWLENTSLVELELGARGRILVRPSGTEPKLKFYVDLCQPLAGQADVWQAEKETRAEARSLAEALVVDLGLS